ncbi:MAG: hypothetical protein R3E09_19090 [Novosphingobium sp.]|nr:hypothetical protein [Novosphingobium sp.]
MIRTSEPKSGNPIFRSALGIALALGVVAGGTVVSSPAIAKKKDKAPKLQFSKGFVAVAGPAQTAIEAAKGRADVTAARDQLNAALQSGNKQQIDAAYAAVNSAIAPEKAQLDQAFAAIESDDDRFLAGSLAVNLGSVAGDPSLQRTGLKTMLASGKADPGSIPRFNAIVGQLAYQAGDYAEAHQYLQRGVDGGFTENNSEVILAESYISDNQAAQGLAVLKHALASREASGTLAPEAWYRRGLASAYKAGMMSETTDFAVMLVRDYPTSENWGAAATIIRELGGFASQETLDLMRLMGRTNSYAEERDYVEYIQAADPRRLPGEVNAVINAGLASGKLRANDTFVSDAKKQATERIAADKASLPSYERDARKASATEATVTGAADALLSYGEPANAEELYTIALGKPGADMPRVLTRLGIAQVDQGKYAAAQETFAKVTGKRQPIARLWSSYAASKVMPTPAPATAAATQ